MLRTAIVSTYAPRHCGIATFTTDLVRAVGRCEIVALQPPDQVEKNPPEVHRVIRRDVRTDHVDAARWVNRCGVSVVSVQHDYGIWGGEDDSHVLDFVGALTLPIVTTLHTLLHEPTPAQLDVMQGLLRQTHATVVMSRAAAAAVDRHLWRGPRPCPCHPARRAGPAVRRRRVGQAGRGCRRPAGAAQLRPARPQQGLRADARGTARGGQGRAYDAVRDPRRDAPRAVADRGRRLSRRG